MKMADARNLQIILFTVFLPACSPTLYPTGEVNICPGDTRVFTCQISMATNMVNHRIDWLIQFEALDLSDVLQSYILADPLGDIHIDIRSVYTFTFNLTSSSSLDFVSTLTVILDANTMVDQTSFSIATVDCNQANNSAILHITTSSPSPPLNLKQSSVQTLGHHDCEQVILLQWNASEAADHYIITVSPTLAGSRSNIMITPSTTIEIPVLHNQEYNISVVASNCAGNSTPAEVMILIVPSVCDGSIEELTFVSDWISDTCSTTEDSTITIHCSDGGFSNFTLETVCSSEGEWKKESTPVTQAQWPSRGTITFSQNSVSSFPPIYTLPIASGFSFAFGLLLGIILTACIVKLRMKASPLTNQDQKQVSVVQVPVYEELAGDQEHTPPGCKVVDNVAYSPVCN